MNDLYGVDPAAPADGRELISLLQMFGPTEGRFIAEFPMNWRDEVQTKLESEKPVAHSLALEWLRRRRHAFLEVAKVYRAGKPWAENAEDLRQIVRSLIGSRGCPPTALPIDLALYGYDALPDARGDLIPRNADAYLKASWPLLAISPKVVLVDPYLKLRGLDDRGRAQAARYRRVIVKLLAESTRLKKVSVFRLVISDRAALEGDPEGVGFEADMKSVLKEAGATRLQLECGVLDQKLHPSRHARYLLGYGCGLQFDHGFDTALDGSTNHVHWLGSGELGPVLEQFDLPGP